MKSRMKSLLAFSFLAGFLALATGCSAFPSALAADPAQSQARLQQDLVKALAERRSSVQLKMIGKESALKKTIKDTLEAAIRADDYLHYVVKTYGYKATIRGNTASISFDFTYWETLEQTNEVKSRVARTLKRIIAPGMNDHQKEKAIHDWIVTNLAYDTRLVSHSAYDGLTEGRTVCQGYALLTYEMMRQAGIPVKIVEGTSRGRAHTWNLVRVGGKWYHLDATWNDPVPDVSGKAHYGYYNLTDSQIRVDHKWKASEDYPSASSDYGYALETLSAESTAASDFYRKLYGQLGYAYLKEEYTASDLSELTAMVRAAADDQRNELVVRYLKGAAVKTDVKKAMNAARGISGISYTYEDYPRTTAKDALVRMQLQY